MAERKVIPDITLTAAEAQEVGLLEQKTLLLGEDVKKTDKRRVVPTEDELTQELVDKLNSGVIPRGKLKARTSW